MHYGYHIIWESVTKNWLLISFDLIQFNIFLFYFFRLGLNANLRNETPTAHKIITKTKWSITSSANIKFRICKFVISWQKKNTFYNIPNLFLVMRSKTRMTNLKQLNKFGWEILLSKQLLIIKINSSHFKSIKMRWLALTKKYYFTNNISHLNSLSLYI